MLHEVENHAGLWLAPVTRRSIVHHGGFRVVRTEAKIINTCASAAQLISKRRIESADVLFGKIAARQAGLIGNDKAVEAAIVEPLDGGDGTRDPGELSRLVHVPVVDVEHAVAIEERGRALPDRRDRSQRLSDAG